MEELKMEKLSMEEWMEPFWHFLHFQFSILHSSILFPYASPLRRHPRRYLAVVWP